VHFLVGDASWLESPSSLSLLPGVARNVCQSLVILYFCLSVLVDGTIFVRNIQESFQPMFFQCSGRRSTETTPSGSMHEKDVEGEGYRATEHPEKLQGTQQHPRVIASPDDWRCGAVSWWILWSALAICLVTFVGLAIGDFDDILGLTAALIASQTTLSWPSFFHYWQFGRIPPQERSCSKHGTGTAFCHCANTRIRSVVDALIIAVSIVLFLFGLWANSQDIANHYQSKHPKLFTCTKLTLKLVQ
jgi:hypothetical protein